MELIHLKSLSQQIKRLNKSKFCSFSSNSLIANISNHHHTNPTAIKKKESFSENIFPTNIYVITHSVNRVIDKNFIQCVSRNCSNF